MANDMVSTSNIWPNYSPTNVQAAAKKPASALDKDAFFKILITQMTNQDPTQPLNDREMIAQMAQFTSVEQLMNINTLLTSMQQSLGASSGLIGKQISWTKEGATPEEKTGVVESIIVRDGAQYAKVGEDEVLLSKVKKIENAAVTEKPVKPEAEHPEHPIAPGTGTDKPAEDVTENPASDPSTEVSGS